MKRLLQFNNAYKTIKNYNTRTRHHRKLNIFDKESITKEHQKTAMKLSKPKKQPKIITRLQNKIKVYTESKAAYGILQLDPTRRHILSHRSLQH